MSFAARLTRVPQAFDPVRGAEVAAALGVSGRLRELVAGAAGSAPYLAGLAEAEGAWLEEVFAAGPEAAREAVLAEVRGWGAGDPSAMLRRAKGRIALLVALADLGGVWELEDVTGTLTAFADLAVEAAVRDAIEAEIRRGRLPGQDDPGSGGGLAVIAMGKMGAGELNYSSDIDLICLFDETRFEPDDYAEARASFVRAVRRMTKVLSDRTAEGYVFRTDLRLRPDAGVTPVAISMEAAERYYESFGRTWERAAYIKARACAGDRAAGRRFLAALTPFVWRRHLDFAAIRDAHDMRLRIREHKGLHGAPSHLGHDLKLGQGGIREIEFFTQTGQIIAGGRDPDLRVPGTLEGLRRLAEKGWIGVEEAAVLGADYRAHRELEHRLQMVADQQTQTLPATEEEFRRIACLSGREPGEFAAEIETRLARVHELTEDFFAPGTPRPAEAPPPEALGPGAEAAVARWQGYPALRSRRAMEIFRRISPALMARLKRAARPDEALRHFDGFLAGLPAGVQVFSLFEANPQLLDLVVDVVDTAPVLAQYLARNSGVFDAVIGGDFFADWPGVAALTESLAAAMAEEADYEARLDRARVWGHEWHFRVGVHHLRGLIGAAEAGRQYAELAEAALRALWPVVVADFAEKHGAPPGAGAAVLGMGSLGAARLSAASDLDLIVIYDGGGVEASDGRRPLATRAYYARLTQSLVTALSALTAKGRLYEVDMRLRPSGRQGPVATSLESFRAYQSEEAWTWEHLALTRARPVAGAEAVAAAVEAFRRGLLAEPRDRGAVLADLAEMRARIAAAKGAGAGLEAKAGPGRLMDIELLGQAAVLIAGSAEREPGAQLEVAGEAFALSPADRALLARASDLFWRVQAASRLIAGTGTVEAEGAGAGAAALLLRETGAGDVAALAGRVAAMAADVAALIDRTPGLGDTDAAKAAGSGDGRG